jgi:WD40 repeat protein
VVALSLPGTGLMSSLRGHRGPVVALAATADGERLVSASQDRTVRVWEVATGRLLRTLEGATGPVRGVAVDGTTRVVAAAGSDGQLRRWHLDTGASLGEPTPAGAPVWSLALGGRNMRLAAGLSDGRVVTFKWPLEGAAREAWRADAAVTAVAWAPRDDRLWAGALAVQAQVQGATAPAAWPGDGRLVRALAVAPDGIRVVRVTAGGAADILTPGSPTAPRRLATGPAPVTALTFAGTELATGHADGTLRVLAGALDP